MDIAASLPVAIAGKIEWMPEYRNQNIVRDVFDRVDAIVVPSIWVENSPLVIHEAQQARVPVITANTGGMAEYVHHEVNGLLFEHRSFAALAEQMQRFVDAPELAAKLGSRGYVFSQDGDIPDIATHVQDIEALYQRVLRRRDRTRLAHAEAPWRITFDTNPDTCNLKCVMCEEHSPHSALQPLRKLDGRSHRRMPFEMLKRVVEEIAGKGLREIIPSTMGEPLLYEHFEDILALCAKHDVKLNLTTNGTFPKYGASDWAARIVPVTSDVKISWNGACKTTHESIMLGSKWEEALRSLREFITVRDAHAANGGSRCRVTLQLTFLESNVEELADIVRLGIELGVDRIKGHHLWAHFPEIEALSMRRNADAIRRWNAAVEQARTIAVEQPLANGHTILLENIFPLDEGSTQELTPDGLCPFLGQEAWVSAQGRFDPCCAPDAQRRALGEFGELLNTPLLDIWQGDAYRALVASYRNRSLCAPCNMRKPAGEAL
jgi:MoaA/NifB/PqqE/SkfB family radical SAM enzyme